MPGPTVKPISGVHHECRLYMRDKQRYSVSAQFQGGSKTTPGYWIRNVSLGRDVYVPESTYSWPGFGVQMEGEIQVPASAPIVRPAGHPYVLSPWGRLPSGDGFRASFGYQQKTLLLKDAYSGTAYDYDGSLDAIVGREVRQDLLIYFTLSLSYLDEDNDEFTRMKLRSFINAGSAYGSDEDGDPYAQLPFNYYEEKTDEHTFVFDAGWSYYYPGFYTQGPA